MTETPSETRARRIDAPWDSVRSDAIQLSLLSKWLVAYVHSVNDGMTKIGKDLCPLCASYTWGRPIMADPVTPEHGGQPDFHDYTRRQCHVCDTIRPEPSDESGRRYT